jgi:hypothetical protein
MFREIRVVPIWINEYVDGQITKILLHQRANLGFKIELSIPTAERWKSNAVDAPST